MPQCRIPAMLLIVALVVSGTPSPRAGPGSVLPTTTLRGSQATDNPQSPNARGLAAAVRRAGLEEDAASPKDTHEERLLHWALEWFGARVWPVEGALYGRSGRARQGPALFDPRARSFKLLVQAWLLARLWLRTSAGEPQPFDEQAITTAITQVDQSTGTLSEDTNATVVGAVWAALGAPPDTMPGTADRLASRIEADLLIITAQSVHALGPFRDAVADAARQLKGNYPALVTPVQQALARIETVQAVLDQLQLSKPSAAQRAALKQCRQWLLWPRRLGVPDAVVYQAKPLARALFALQQAPSAPDVSKLAQTVQKLLVKRGLVQSADIEQAGRLAESDAAVAVQARLTALGSLLEGLAGAAAHDGDTLPGVFSRMTQGRAPALGDLRLRTAKDLGTLLDIRYPDAALRHLLPAQQAVVAWAPEVVRLIRTRYDAGRRLDPAALYHDLELSVEAYAAGLADLARRGVLTGSAASRAEARVGSWQAQIWIPRSRPDVFMALITRILAHIKLPVAAAKVSPPAVSPADATAASESSIMADVLEGLTEGLDLSGRTSISVVTLAQTAGEGGWPAIRTLLGVADGAAMLADDSELFLVWGPVVFRVLAARAAKGQSTDSETLSRLLQRVAANPLRVTEAADPRFARWRQIAAQAPAEFDGVVRSFVGRARSSVGVAQETPAAPETIHPAVLQARLFPLAVTLEGLGIWPSGDPAREWAHSAHWLVNDPRSGFNRAYAALVTPEALGRLVGVSATVHARDLSASQRALLAWANPIILTMIYRHRTGDSLAPQDVYDARNRDDALPPASLALMKLWNEMTVWGTAEHRQHEVTGMIARIEQAVGLATAPSAALPTTGLEEDRAVAAATRQLTALLRPLGPTSAVQVIAAGAVRHPELKALKALHGLSPRVVVADKDMADPHRLVGALQSLRGTAETLTVDYFGEGPDALAFAEAAPDWLQIRRIVLVADDLVEDSTVFDRVTNLGAVVVTLSEPSLELTVREFLHNPDLGLEDDALDAAVRHTQQDLKTRWQA